ncbi:MAG: TRAP transporter small permease [Saccharospirillaceae bacterium]|nr:TRAP transporter small permease [Pseudomonadales bacterium]NRB81287.1 TRAP transporter small permease [Saccharospirillaceae bacterium]
MKAIHFIRKYLRLVESSLLISALFAIILLTVMQIVMRNLKSLVIYLTEQFDFINITYQIPVFSWTESLNQHLVLVIAFVGAMVAGRKGEHIAFDVFQHYMPSRFKYHVALVGAIISGFICFYLAYLCSMITLDNITEGYSIIVFANVPQWVFEIVIPIGFFIIGYRLIKVGIYSLYNRRTINQI